MLHSRHPQPTPGHITELPLVLLRSSRSRLLRRRGVLFIALLQSIKVFKGSFQAGIIPKGGISHHTEY